MPLVRGPKPTCGNYLDSITRGRRRRERKENATVGVPIMRSRPQIVVIGDCPANRFSKKHNVFDIDILGRADGTV